MSSILSPQEGAWALCVGRVATSVLDFLQNKILRELKSWIKHLTYFVCVTGKYLICLLSQNIVDYTL